MSSSAKCHRATGSEGHRSPPCQSLPPAPGTITSDFVDGVASAFPSDRDEELACPFVKHNPEAYKHARNACTIAGYRSISTLKEHIKRVHLLKYSCLRCHKRFACKETELADSKRKHKCDLNRKPRQESDVEVTTEEQDERFLKLDFRSRGLTSEDAYIQIFRAFWPETSEEDVPSAYFRPGFLFSMPEIRAVLKEIEHRRYMSAMPNQSPVETQAGGSFTTPQLPTPTLTLPFFLTPPSYPHGLLIANSNFPYAAGYNSYTGIDFTSIGSGYYPVDLNSIQGNTVVGSQGPPLPVSSQNLGAQQHQVRPPFDYTVTQGKRSTDSAYYSLEQSETDPAYNSGPTATAYHRVTPEHNPHLFSNMLPGAAGFTNSGPYSQDLDDDLLPGPRGRGC